MGNPLARNCQSEPSPLFALSSPAHLNWARESMQTGQPGIRFPNCACNFLRPCWNTRTKTAVTAKILLLSVAMLLSGVAQATIISLGQVDLTGNFTLNHHYNFNNPSAFPFGTFGTLTVQDASGIFAPYVGAGDTLGMNTQFMFGPITAINSDVSSPMIWRIGGFTINTQKVLVTGADFAGRSCLGITDLSGNGFDPNDYPPFGAFSFWDFIAPPYDISNFHEDITGPITLKIAVGYDRRRGTGQGAL